MPWIYPQISWAVNKNEHEVRLQIKVGSTYTLLISAVFQCMVIVDQGSQIFPGIKSVYLNLNLLQYIDMLQTQI